MEEIKIFHKLIHPETISLTLTNQLTKLYVARSAAALSLLCDLYTLLQTRRMFFFFLLQPQDGNAFNSLFSLFLLKLSKHSLHVETETPDIHCLHRSCVLTQQRSHQVPETRWYTCFLFFHLSFFLQRARHSSVTLPKYPFCMETGHGVRGSDCWQDGAWYSPSHLAPTAPDWLVGRYARKCKIQLDTTRGSPLPLHFIVKREGAKVVCSFLCMCFFFYYGQVDISGWNDLY